MIDKLVEKYTNLFKQYGDPNNYKDYLKDNQFKILNVYYIGYTTGLLKETIAASGELPRIKEKYDNNIDELIDRIKNNKDLNKTQVIYISNEINNIEELTKLKKAFADKVIVTTYNNNLAFIDDTISAIHMIDYYKSIIDDSLSDLEKITIAYDLIKSFKYNDYKDKRTVNSRQITKIVNTGNIVCVGYVELFNKLLKELNIESYHMSISLKDNEEHLNHSRSMVKINDEKYGINGYYTFDPTFDSTSNKTYTKIENDTFHGTSLEKTKDFKETDTFSPYNHFLIPIRSYRSKYPYSYDETIKTSNGNMLSAEATQEALYNKQSDTIQNDIIDSKLVELLYNVRLAEGYSIEEIPKSIQEALYISFGKPYTINSIIDCISKIEKEVKKH